MAKANKRKLEVVTFEEARRHFADKVPLTRPEFDALRDEVKRRAFTVATVSKMDVLKDFKNAVEKAIEKGETLANFRERMLDFMEERGWKGTTPWHAETIFRTNLQSSYGAGRFEQQKALGEEYPYAEYHAISDDRVREEHEALDGTVAHIDSTFWQIHYPPWDYNCRCSAEPLSAEEVEGRQIEEGYGPAPSNDFTSPAVGADFEPDLTRFDPDEREQILAELSRRT